ncbi:hypothetical protein U0070_010194, partial [Myodes glareolus]
TALGMLGNSVLLSCFVIADFSGIRANPTDLIVKHLTWANLIVLCKGIPQSTAAFSQNYYLDYVSCKLTLYFHRVARGVSLGSTSLLSVFQAITFSPSNSKLTQLKVRAPRFIGPSLGLCWAIQLLVYVFIPVYTTDIWGERNVIHVCKFFNILPLSADETLCFLFQALLYLFSSDNTLCLCFQRALKAELSTGVGITGISKLLYYYSFALLTGENVRPADLIFNPLAFPNNLILLFRGISEICSAFQYKHFLNDFFSYLNQVARSFLLVPHGFRVHSRPQIFDSDSIGISSSERDAQDLL